MRRRLDIYLDESGDLGARGSDHFVVAATATFDPEVRGRIAKRARARFNTKRRGDIEFSFHRSSDDVRGLFMNEISSVGCWIGLRAIRKKEWHVDGGPKARRLYDAMCSSVVADLLRCMHPRSVDLVLDKHHSNASMRRALDNKDY